MTKINKISLFVAGILAMPFAVSAAELSHSFNSPSFSGTGYSSHVLTLNQLETQAKDKNKAAADALQAKIESAAANSPEARFLASLESRVYAQLAKQLTDSMFGGATPCTSQTSCGILPDLGGNTVKWRMSNPAIIDPKTNRPEPEGMIVIEIQNNSISTQYTKMMVPSGTFYF